MRINLAEILLIEDNPGDVRLTTEALKEINMQSNLHVVNDGEKALAFLQQQGSYSNAVRPDLILLDLNLPKKSGREVLARIKTNSRLRCIPVIILTTSKSEKDIEELYNLHANCYIVKPADFEQFINAVKAIVDFWLAFVKLPGS
jgi:chemotaxis family two-component system response regulator Rcp1